MKRQALRFIGFMLIFALLFSWGNSALRMAKDSWINLYRLPQNSIDVLLMGNSHNYYTYQPQIINDIVPVNAYSLGISGENMPVTYYELREILKYQKPKLVVLETFTIHLAEMLYPIQVVEFIDSSPWSLNKAAVAARYLSLKNAYSVFPLLRTRVDWNDPDSFFIGLKDRLRSETKEISPELGYFPISQVMSEQEYSAAFQLVENHADNSLQDNLHFLDRFVEFCRSNATRLLFTTSPVIRNSGDFLKYYIPFDEDAYAAANEIHQVVFDRSQLNELHFSDPGHVNSFGSVIVSIDMAQQIAQELDLPINQEMLAYYRSFVFSGYTLAHTGNEYVLTLTPENPDAPLEYQFEVTEAESKEIESSTGWQPGCEYRFQLPAYGSYNVDTKIRNSAGDYEINALFRINHDEPKP